MLEATREGVFEGVGDPWVQDSVEKLGDGDWRSSLQLQEFSPNGSLADAKSSKLRQIFGDDDRIGEETLACYPNHEPHVFLCRNWPTIAFRHVIWCLFSIRSNIEVLVAILFNLKLLEVHLAKLRLHMSLRLSLRHVKLGTEQWRIRLNKKEHYFRLMHRPFSLMIDVDFMLLHPGKLTAVATTTS